VFPLRDENPRVGYPLLVVSLIALNALVFAHEVQLGPDVEAFIHQYAILPVEVAWGTSLPGSMEVPPYLTLVTSMFLHGSFGHLLGNMWFLWIFGDNIEDRFGHFRFLAFYLIAGVAAGIVHVQLHPNSTIPTVGASGAVSGVLGAYTVLYPHIRVRTLLVLVVFWQVIRVPAVLFLGLWFLAQAMGLFSARSELGAGVAFGAHLGGFVVGALVAFFLRFRGVRT
jgi:membrane associated rhomboid family serine protease